MPLIKPDISCAGQVRVRAKAPDPLEGVRGHLYIAARQLNPPVQRLDANPDRHTERVNNILDQWKPLGVVIQMQFSRPRQVRKAGRR